MRPDLRRRKVVFRCRAGARIQMGHAYILNIFFMAKADNTVAQMRKGVLEMCILAVIAGREVYASDILSELKNSQLLVVEGTLYPILTRLKNDGSLNYRWEESSSGPPRKYYSITPLGVEMLQELREGWQGLIESVNQLLVQSDSTLSSTEKIN